MHFPLLILSDCECSPIMKSFAIIDTTQSKVNVADNVCQMNCNHMEVYICPTKWILSPTIPSSLIAEILLAVSPACNLPPGSPTMKQRARIGLIVTACKIMLQSWPHIEGTDIRIVHVHPMIYTSVTCNLCIIAGNVSWSRLTMQQRIESLKQWLGNDHCCIIQLCIYRATIHSFKGNLAVHRESV